MNYYTHVESNRFKVKDPKKFQEEFNLRVGGDDIELAVFEDGFQFWATNPYISNPAYDEDVHAIEECQMDDLDIPDIVQPHLKDGEVLSAVYLCSSSKNSGLGCQLCIATNIAISWEHQSSVFKTMKKNLYPRYVKCNTSCLNKETDRWIEEGKEYKAIKLLKKNNRWYYIVDCKGHEVTWSKEYFDDSTEGERI